MKYRIVILNNGRYEVQHQIDPSWDWWKDNDYMFLFMAKLCMKNLIKKDKKYKEKINGRTTAKIIEEFEV